MTKQDDSLREKMKNLSNEDKAISIGMFGKKHTRILKLMNQFVASIDKNSDLKFLNKFQTKMPPTKCGTPKCTCVLYKFLQKSSNTSFSFKVVNPFNSFYHLHNFADYHYDDDEFMLFSDGMDLEDIYYQLEYINNWFMYRKHLTGHLYYTSGKIPMPVVLVCLTTDNTLLTKSKWQSHFLQQIQEFTDRFSNVKVKNMLIFPDDSCDFLTHIFN
jgi:hypothetical protein